jgi:hypothetical protein
MAAYTPRQVRDIGVEALAGNVPPANDVQSDDAKMSVGETQRLQAEAQARISSGRADTVGVRRDRTG